MTNPPGHWANASATDSAEGGGCKVRIRRNLVVDEHICEWPDSARKPASNLFSAYDANATGSISAASLLRTLPTRTLTG
jgi:hypothetical protein